MGALSVRCTPLLAQTRTHFLHGSLFFVILLIFRKHLPLSLWIYSVAALVIPYLTVSGEVGFVSFTRYSLMAFPVFIILGELFQRRVWLGLSVLGLFSAMLFMYSAFYAQFYWAG